MPRMPTYDEIRDDFERGIRTAEQHIEHPFRHRAADTAPQTPATRPATIAAATAAAPQQEDTMQLTAIAGDIKNAVENADQWVKEVTETHLPAVLAVAQKYESSPIVQALETALLPPEVEAGIAGTIRELAKLYPSAVAAAQPADPAQQPAGAPAQ